MKFGSSFSSPKRHEGLACELSPLGRHRPFRPRCVTQSPQPASRPLGARKVFGTREIGSGGSQQFDSRNRELVAFAGTDSHQFENSVASRRRPGKPVCLLSVRLSPDRMSPQARPPLLTGHFSARTRSLSCLQQMTSTHYGLRSPQGQFLAT